MGNLRPFLLFLFYGATGTGYAAFIAVVAAAKNWSELGALKGETTTDTRTNTHANPNPKPPKP